MVENIYPRSTTYEVHEAGYRRSGKGGRRCPCGIQRLSDPHQTMVSGESRYHQLEKTELAHLHIFGGLCCEREQSSIVINERTHQDRSSVVLSHIIHQYLPER